MSSYPAVPVLTGKHKLRRLLWVSAVMIVWGCTLVAFPNLVESTRGTTSRIAPFFILGLWSYLIYAYVTAILKVEIADDHACVANWARTKRIPLESIGSVEAFRSRGKLKKIILRDRQTRPIGTIPIIRGSRRIDQAEELLAELESIVGPDEVTAL